MSMLYFSTSNELWASAEAGTINFPSHFQSNCGPEILIWKCSPWCKGRSNWPEAVTQFASFISQEAEEEGGAGGGRGWRPPSSLLPVSKPAGRLQVSDLRPFSRPAGWLEIQSTEITFYIISMSILEGLLQHSIYYTRKLNKNSNVFCITLMSTSL